MRQTLFLTGATGFLGGTLLRALHQDYEIVAPVRATATAERASELEKWAYCPRFATVEDLADMVRDVAPANVIHAAASYGRTHEGLARLLQSNVTLGLMLFDALNDVDQPVHFLNVGTALQGEVSAYALSKVQFAEWGKALCAQAGSKIAFTNARLQLFYGPGDRPDSFLTRMVRMMLAEVPRLDLTHGYQKRDFIAVSDVVRALELLLATGSPSGYRDVDVGTGTSRSVRSVIELLAHMTSCQSTLNFGGVPMRPNEPADCVADPRLLRSLGWSAKVELEPGLAELIEAERTR